MLEAALEESKQDKEAEGSSILLKESKYIRIGKDLRDHLVQLYYTEYEFYKRF